MKHWQYTWQHPSLKKKYFAEERLYLKQWQIIPETLFWIICSSWWQVVTISHIITVLVVAALIFIYHTFSSNSSDAEDDGYEIHNFSHCSIHVRMCFFNGLCFFILYSNEACGRWTHHKDKGQQLGSFMRRMYVVCFIRKFNLYVLVLIWTSDIKVSSQYLASRFLIEKYLQDCCTRLFSCKYTYLCIHGWPIIDNIHLVVDTDFLWFVDMFWWRNRCVL